MMVKHILNIALILQCLFLQAQKDVFIYSVRHQYPADQIPTETALFALDIGSNKTIFRTLDERRSDSLIEHGQYGYGHSQNVQMQLYVVTNRETGKIERSYANRLDVYYSVPFNESAKWTLLGEQKMMNGYKAQAATTKLGGRNWKVWFTADIPIPEGPYAFRGLPGLVIKATDSEGGYQFELIKILQNKAVLYSRKNQINLTVERFQKMMQEYYRAPFSDLKGAGMGQAYTSNAEGKVVPLNMRAQEQALKRVIKEKNDPIDLNYKNDYP